MKKAYIVLGMHRSGTSLVSAILSLLDIGIKGDIEGVKRKLSNPTIGEFENVEIVKVNESILKHFKSNWMSPYNMPKNWWEREECSPFKQAFKDAIISEFGDRDTIAYKDPRSSICYPLHVPILREMGYQADGIFVKRDINAIANSLELRNKIHKKIGFKIANCYLDNIRKQYHDIPLFRIQYENILSDTEGELKRIVEHFNSDIDLEEFFEKVKDYIDPQLNHYKNSLNE